jgi:hypothetical protein
MALQPNSGPGLPFWDFLTVTFYGAGLLVQNPTPNLEDQVSVFMTPGTGWPSYTPRHWVPILVAFYDMNGLQWEYSLIPATTRETTLECSYLLAFMQLRICVCIVTCKK